MGRSSTLDAGTQADRWLTGWQNVAGEGRRKTSFSSGATSRTPPIRTWRLPVRNIKAVAEGGFKMIFSNSDGLYLDCGFAGWVWDSPSWCSPYKGWQTVYQNDPYAILETHGVANLDEAKGNVVGAEVAMWTEQTDDQSLLAKVRNDCFVELETWKCSLKGRE